MTELNACWNSVIRRIFGYKRYESVKAVTHGLGRVNVKFQLPMHKVKFYRRLFLKSNLLHDVFWVYLLLILMIVVAEQFLARCTLPSIIYC